MFALTRQDTAVLKGIAICAMLCHHLYGYPPDGVEPYSGMLAWFGVLGKVCVAMFLFCSGYGLASQYGPSKSVLSDVKFVLRRLTKFYLNYWVIFVIFVPISVFLFHRPLSAAYGEHVNIAKRLIYDLLGMQGMNSYNITWWFNQLIIILYLLFPLSYRVVHFKPWLALLGGMVLMRIASHIPYNPADFCTWQLPFVLGMVWKCYETKGVGVQEWLEKHKAIAVLSSMCILCCMILLRMYPIIPHWSGIRMDGFLSCAIALCVITIIRNLKYTNDVFAFFGKHSMNIYMTHTFLNWYWCKEWLHTGEWLRGGGNLLILILLCLAISIAIEFLKQKIGIYKLTKYITDKL